MSALSSEGRATRAEQLAEKTIVEAGQDTEKIRGNSIYMHTMGLTLMLASHIALIFACMPVVQCES